MAWSYLRLDKDVVEVRNWPKPARRIPLASVDRFDMVTPEEGFFFGPGAVLGRRDDPTPYLALLLKDGTAIPVPQGSGAAETAIKAALEASRFHPASEVAAALTRPSLGAAAIDPTVPGAEQIAALIASIPEPQRRLLTVETNASGITLIPTGPSTSPPTTSIRVTRRGAGFDFVLARAGGLSFTTDHVNDSEAATTLSAKLADILPGTPSA